MAYGSRRSEFELTEWRIHYKRVAWPGEIIQIFAFLLPICQPGVRQDGIEGDWKKLAKNFHSENLSRDILSTSAEIQP
jgi:hypothetical protein